MLRAHCFHKVHLLLLVLCSALASNRYALADLIEFDIEEYDDDYTSGVIFQNSDDELKTIDGSYSNAGQYSRDSHAELSIPKISEKQYIQTSSPNVETSKTTNIISMKAMTILPLIGTPPSVPSLVCSAL